MIMNRFQVLLLISSFQLAPLHEGCILAQEPREMGGTLLGQRPQGKAVQVNP
jgi:hypothetical protein